MSSIMEELYCHLNTNDGPVCGNIECTGGRTYYTFNGIPYAKPPVGNLRFLPPLPITPWTQEIDCTKKGPEPLTFSFTQEIVGSEDCLYIDVYTPNLKPGKPLAVMFWIGSNAFTFNLDSIYDSKLINNENVIFVRCNFRLGPFGFLSFNDFGAPGNCGLKDIVLALKWVQRNINTFGGDPNNITVFGNSSGGVITHFLILSPMATGLFHKAIIQSASALNNWAVDNNPSKPVMELAKLLDINITCQTEMIEKLRTISATKIMKAFKIMDMEARKGNNVIDIVFKPCIELEFEGQPAFLSRSPHAILKSGIFNKIPLIIGSNNTEAAMLQFVKQDYYPFEKINENVSLLVPRSLALNDSMSQFIGQQLLKFYLGDEEKLREDTRVQYLQLISDYYFLYHVNKTVRLHSQAAPNCRIYYYILNYAGEWVLPNSLQFFNSLGHCSEIPFIFGIKVPGKLDEPICKGSRDSVTTRNRMVRLWTNFAKYGNPTPVDGDALLQITWDPVEDDKNINFLSIGLELTKGKNPFCDRMKFWDNLHRQHIFLRAQVYMHDLGVSW